MSGNPIVVLTALDVEYAAVREKLDMPRLRRHPQGTRFEVGRLTGGRTRIALGLVGKGNQSAAVLAERAIAEFSPPALLFAGVAGALQSHISLGDVVVATHIYAFHGGTSEDDGFRAAPVSGRCRTAPSRSPGMWPGAAHGRTVSMPRTSRCTSGRSQQAKWC